jgi:hypothetical protein
MEGGDSDPVNSNSQISISVAASDLRRQGKTKQLGRFNNAAPDKCRTTADNKYEIED